MKRQIIYAALLMAFVVGVLLVSASETQGQLTYSPIPQPWGGHHTSSQTSWRGWYQRW